MLSLDDNPRRRRLALTVFVLFLTAWDIWAVAVDQRLKLPDTFVMHTLLLRQAAEAGAWWPWLANLGPKGPLGPLLALPLLWLLSAAPLAMRLVTALCHGALVLQAYDLGRWVTGRPRAGLWAALLTGTCPFLFGICRLAYHDVLLGVAVIGAMQLMLRVRLDRPVPAAALGLVLGLGLLTKHSYSLYMVGPGLWFVARRLRGVRQLANLALMGLVMVAVAALWAVPNGASMVENLMANTSLGDVPLSAELGFYLSLPGAAPLFVLAAPSIVLLGAIRRVTIWNLMLFCTFVLMFAGLHSVTAAARYMVPVIPMWAVMAGGGLDWLQEKMPRRVAGGLSLAATVGLLALFVTVHFTGVEAAQGVPREDYGGIIKPEQRGHDGYARAIRALSAHGPDVLLAFDSLMGYCEKDGHDVLWSFRGVPLFPIRPDDAKRRLAAGQGVSVLLVRQFPHRPLSAPPPPDLWPPVAPGEHSSLGELAQTISWVLKQPKRRVVASTTDPDGTRFEAIRIEP